MIIQNHETHTPGMRGCLPSNTHKSVRHIARIRRSRSTRRSNQVVSRLVVSRVVDSKSPVVFLGRILRSRAQSTSTLNLLRKERSSILNHAINLALRALLSTKTLTVVAPLVVLHKTRVRDVVRWRRSSSLYTSATTGFLHDHCEDYALVDAVFLADGSDGGFDVGGFGGGVGGEILGGAARGEEGGEFGPHGVEGGPFVHGGPSASVTSVWYFGS